MAIKVLVVDDSALMRSVLSDIINKSGDMHAVGAAANGLIAAEMIKQLDPDVLTLDIEMPQMGGLELLEQLMKQRPLPVVMISSQTERGSESTLRALELGAVDFVTKPRLIASQGMRAYSDEICEKIRGAYGARLSDPDKFSAGEGAGAVPAGGAGLDAATLRDRLICIGASTGGTEAIKAVLTSLPEQVPGIVMVQHMPEMFTTSFAKRLDGLCRVRVKEADDGERVLPGHAYLAPGHSHLSVRRNGGNYYCELLRTEPVNRHRPSVDVLFSAAARTAGSNALGIILTGMGKDGAQGMLEMRRAGSWNIGQDQASCVVYGMPREAWTIGAVDEQAPLREIAPRLLARLRQAPRRSA